MIYIFGLGNPGKKYEYNRHNAGFLVIDKVAAFFQIKLRKRCLHNYQYAQIESNNSILVKPLTYMNRSGDILHNFSIDKENDTVIVICDNMDLPAGKIRIKRGGGSGGQKGLSSIINLLGYSDFIRLYVGTNRPKPGVSVVDHVLSNPEGEELKHFLKAIDNSAEAIVKFIEGHKLEEIQLEYNGRNES